MSDTREAQTSKQQRPFSVWELPKLLQSVHSHRKGNIDSPKERPHFSGILAFVYRNRFAIASQVQRRFSKYLRSDRTTRRHLAEMESLGYLDVAPTNNTSPLWPKVYFVTKRGLKRLKEAYAERGQTWKPYIADRKRSEGISAQHILHELFTTEFLLMAWETVQKQNDLELLKVERRSLVKHPAFRFSFAGKQTRLEPDGMFLYRQNGAGMMCCFVEIDLGTMSRRQLEAKFQKYQVWGDSEQGTQYVKSTYSHFGATNPRNAFRILFVDASGNGNEFQVTESNRLEFLSQLSESLRQRLWFSHVPAVPESKSCDLFRWNWMKSTGKQVTLFPIPVFPRD